MSDLDESRCTSVKGLQHICSVAHLWFQRPSETIRKLVMKGIFDSPGIFARALVLKLTKLRHITKHSYLLCGVQWHSRDFILFDYLTPHEVVSFDALLVARIDGILKHRLRASHMFTTRMETPLTTPRRPCA